MRAERIRKGSEQQALTIKTHDMHSVNHSTAQSAQVGIKWFSASKA